MKKIVLFIAILALSLVVVACGTTKKDNNQNQPQDNQSVGDTNAGQNNEDNGTDGTNGTSGTDGNTGTNQDDQTNAANQDQLTKMDALDYDEFTLDVDYGNQNDYEVELERNRDDTIEAEIDDSINGVKKKGTEAFDELYPLVEKLTIGQQTSKEDAIKEVLNVFNLKEDYTKLEVEITFKDGTKLEFEDRK